MKSPFPQILLLSFLTLLVACSEHKPMTDTPATKTNSSAPLVGSDWLLTTIAGTPVISGSKASLSFLDGERAAGNGSCNRFTGSVTISGDSLKFGAMASTRMACMSNGFSAQEDQYLKLLAAAKRYELKDNTLLIYADGFDKPLQFSRQTNPSP